MLYFLHLFTQLFGNCGEKSYFLVKSCNLLWRVMILYIWKLHKYLLLSKCWNISAYIVQDLSLFMCFINMYIWWHISISVAHTVQYNGSVCVTSPHTAVHYPSTPSWSRVLHNDLVLVCIWVIMKAKKPLDLVTAALIWSVILNI